MERRKSVLIKHGNSVHPGKASKKGNKGQPRCLRARDTQEIVSALEKVCMTRREDCLVPACSKPHQDQALAVFFSGLNSALK